MKARIGIISEDLVRKRILAIASGKYKPASDEPKIWFTSLEAVSHILNEKNIELLRLIDEQRPQSITELAELSGRKKSNLSTTLKTLNDKGFVRMEKKSGNIVKPVALFTEFDIVISKEIELKILEATEGAVKAA